MREEKEFIPPTYEEYIKATIFARIRYKYGLVITLITAILLCLLILFIVVYANELKSNPLVYGAKKFDVTCDCISPMDSNNNYHLYINSTTMQNVKEEAIKIDSSFLNGE